MVHEFSFLVDGSEPEPYEVVFLVDGRTATATCTCKGYYHGLICKHRVGLLHDYDPQEMDSETAANVAALRDAIAGTDVGIACAEYLQARDEAEDAKKWLTKVKTKFAQVMDK